MKQRSLAAGENMATAQPVGSFSGWMQQHQAQMQALEVDEEEGLTGSFNRFIRDRGLGAVQDQTNALATRFVASIRGEDGVLTAAKNRVQTTVNYGAKLRNFICMLLLGILFYLLAFFVGLPVILFRPVKFALCATLGSCSLLGSFAALVGPKAHLQSLCQRDRLPFTSAYVGSLLLTLYASLVIRSYLLVVISTCVQIGAFVWYLMAYLPGGPAGLRTLSLILVRIATTSAARCGQLLRCCLR